MSTDIALYKRHVLKRLYFRKKVGELYTPKENMMHGLPAHMKNMRLIEAAIKELLNQGLLEQHKKGTCISIHRHQIFEVRRRLGIKR